MTDTKQQHLSVLCAIRRLIIGLSATFTKAGEGGLFNQSSIASCFIHELDVLVSRSEKAVSLRHSKRGSRETLLLLPGQRKDGVH